MKVSGLPAVSRVWNFGSHAPRGLASPWPRPAALRATSLGMAPCSQDRGHGVLEATSQTMSGDIAASSPKKDHLPIYLPKIEESELLKQILTTSLKFIPSFCFSTSKKISPPTNFPAIPPPHNGWTEFP